MEVKYIKVVVLNNGGVSINYDYKISKNEDIAQTVIHILNALSFAYNHFMKKITENK